MLVSMHPGGVANFIVCVDGYAPKVMGPYRFPEVGPDADRGSRETDGASPFDFPKGVDVDLEPGFPFEVRVLDDQGSPIMGAEVSASLVLDSMPVMLPNPLYTDADGRVVFSNLSNADYEFQVKLHGDHLADDLIAVRVEPGGKASITLDRGPVSGVALDESGSPVEDALLLIGTEHDDQLRRTITHLFDRIVLARSDGQGRFVLPALHSGSTYLIRAEGPDMQLGFAPAVRRDSKDVRVTIHPMRIVRGVVVGAPPGRRTSISVQRTVSSGFNVQGKDGDVPYPFTLLRGILTDQDGGFEFQTWDSVENELKIGDRSVPVPRSLPEEPWKVEYVPPVVKVDTTTIALFVEGADAFHQGTMTLHLNDPPPELSLMNVTRQVAIRDSIARFDSLSNESFRIETDSIPGLWTTPGRISNASAETAVEVRAYPTGVIAGRLLNADGSNASGVKVKVEFIPNQGRTKSGPDLDGRMTAGNPPGPGEFRVTGRESQGIPRLMSSFRLVKEVESDAEGRFEIANAPIGVATVLIVEEGRYHVPLGEVNLDAESPRKEVEARLPKKVGASVRVVDPEGRPISGVQGQLRIASSSVSRFYRKFGVSDADGRISVDDLAETGTDYVLHVEFSGDFRPISVPLKPGGPELELQAERGRVLEGRIVEAVTGWPIPGMRIAIGSEEDVTQEAVKTDVDGRFRFSTLPPGALRFLETSPQMQWIYPASRLVPADEHGPIEIRVINQKHFGSYPRPIPIY